jgi:hypothetical protein
MVDGLSTAVLFRLRPDQRPLEPAGQPDEVAELGPAEVPLDRGEQDPCRRGPVTAGRGEESVGVLAHLAGDRRGVRAAGRLLQEAHQGRVSFLDFTQQDLHRSTSGGRDVL